MKFLGKRKITWIAVAMIMGIGSLSTVTATPIAFRIHNEMNIAQEVPDEGSLTKEEKKAIRKQKRAEKKALQAEMAATQQSATAVRAGWRNVFIPGYGYQTVYVDAFGYPSHDILGRSLYRAGFGSPYYRRYPRRVIVRRCAPLN